LCRCCCVAEVDVRRFFLDGWLNILYLIVFVTIVYILRPSANNKQFAMSDELRQDDDDFDLSSLHDLESGDIDDDAALYDPPDYDHAKPTSTKTEDKKGLVSGSGSGSSPVLRRNEEGEGSSAPMLTRQSEEGAVFSIGDDEFGNWADDDDR